jgi:hypothetical protein
MKTKSGLLFLIFLAFASVPFQAIAQKDINEECENDADCQSGHCVTVRRKDGEKKVCSLCDQSQLDDYTSNVTDKCKNLDAGIFGYVDVESEFKSQNEVSLVNLHSRAKYVNDCYDAPSDRENTCFDQKYDDEHQEEMDKLTRALNALNRLIDKKTENKLGYNCEPDKYHDLQEDIKENCEDIDKLFEKYAMHEGEVSCSDLSALTLKLVDCRQAFKEMVDDPKNAPND